MSETHYQCDCDKYNPECRCYPKPVVTEHAMREAVKSAIAEHVHNVPVLYGDASEDYIGGIDEAADAAIAAATPFIEAALIGRLAQRAEKKHEREEAIRKIDIQPQPQKTFQLFADWLRAQLEPHHERP